MERSLGRLEEVFWCLDKAKSTNFVAAIELEGRLDEGLLRQALDLAQIRHPLLSTRILHERGARFSSDGVGVIPLSVMNISCPEEVHDVVERELDVPFSWSEGPLIRVQLLDDGREHTLVVAVSHVIGDGASLVIFARELMVDYLQLLAGVRPSVVRRAPRPPVEELLPIGVGGPRALSMITRFLHGKGRDIALGHPRKLAPARISRETKSRFISRILPRDDVEVLVRRSRGLGVTIHGLLAAASLQAVYDVMKETGSVTMSCMSPVNMRPFLTEALGDDIGFYVSNLATFHEVGQSPLATLAVDVNRTIRAAMDRGEHHIFVAIQGFLALMSPVPRLMSRFVGAVCPAAVVVTNMGVIRLPNLGPIGLRAVHAAASTNAIVGTGVTVAAATVDGVMSLDFVYNDPLVAHETAAAVADRGVALLRGL